MESAEAEDLIISRLTKTNSQGSIVDWIQTVEAKLPRFRVFIDFMLVSGLRFGESVNSFNLIIDLGKKRRLAEYYTKEQQVLEHYKFKETFIRGNKKVSISFLPREVI